MAKDPVRNNVIIKERKRRLFLGLPFSFTTYTLTDKVLLIKTGFFNSIEDEVKLYRIIDMTIHRSLLQKIVGLGTLEVSSSDKSSRDFKIENIKHVKEFRAYLTEYLERDRRSRGMRGAEMIDGGFEGYDTDGDHFGDGIHDHCGYDN